MCSLVSFICLLLLNHAMLGHMVPEFKPEAALAFMSKWIADSDWLPYNASCTPAAEQEKLAAGFAETAAAAAAELRRVEDQIAKLQARARTLRKSVLPAGAP